MRNSPLRHGRRRSEESKRRMRRSRAVTLVELLVVIGIILLLIAVMAPAVVSVREASRSTSCRNNLRQIGVGMESVLGTHGFYPSGGWGYGWAAEAEKGVGCRQPGSWLAQLEPFIGAPPVDVPGVHDEEVAVKAIRARHAARLNQVYGCPGRRSNQLLPAGYVVPYNALWTDNVAKCDYAACGGSIQQPMRHDWPGDESGLLPAAHRALWNGVTYPRSQTRPAEIQRGLSQTLLVAEKSVPVADYEGWHNLGYNQSFTTGACADTLRFTVEAPIADRSATRSSLLRFGGPHGTLLALFCDGSVRSLDFNVDINLFAEMGNRTTVTP